MIQKREYRIGHVTQERGICRCIHQHCNGCPMNILGHALGPDDCTPRRFDNKILFEPHCLYEYITEFEEVYDWSKKDMLSIYLETYLQAHIPADVDEPAIEVIKTMSKAMSHKDATKDVLMAIYDEAHEEDKEKEDE